MRYLWMECQTPSTSVRLNRSFKESCTESNVSRWLEIVRLRSLGFFKVRSQLSKKRAVIDFCR